MKSLVLLSGGLDSCVAAAMAFELQQNPVHALSIHYGQKHYRELTSAENIAEAFNISHTTIHIDDIVDHIKYSTALINPDEELPQDRALSAMTARVPRSYVPGRNTIFLSIAQSIAEANDYDRIITGFNAVDFSGYPDCRPIFVDAWNHLAKYATRRGYEQNNPIQLVTPIINMSKATVVYHGIRLNAPLHLTWSCYQGGAKACGRCDSCRIRRDAFKENNIEDPIEYEETISA